MPSRRPAGWASQRGDVSLSYVAVVLVVALVAVVMTNGAAPRMAAGVERGVRCAIDRVVSWGGGGGCGASGPDPVAAGPVPAAPVQAGPPTEQAGQPDADDLPDGVVTADLVAGLGLLAALAASVAVWYGIYHGTKALHDWLFGTRSGPDVDQRQPLDYEKLLGDSQVVAFGERPMSVDTKRALLEALPELQRQGITDLWLEALPPGGRYQFAIRSQLHEEGKRLGVGDTYLNLYDRARQLGINVEAAGPPQQGAELAASATYEPTNREWADSVTQLLKQYPDRRVAILGAAGHFGQDGRTFDGMLRDAGQQPVVVFFHGGDARTLQERAPELSKAYDRLAREPGPSMVRPSSLDAGDWVILIPHPRGRPATPGPAGGNAP